ncbi:DNA cytosine methyltransferase [Rossellomorea aquimaris]|uniref:DNA cytosine methyltransferase n=1 Tax=Rossellomorea aquimaris TaxID=189382 RepID=UPI003CF8B421
MKEILQVMDLFAGAGGLSSGFEQLKKFKVKIAVEINENARKTYELNHPDVIFHKDITELKYKDENGSLREDYKDIDVIIGGPPCQGFSNANRQKNSLISSNNNLIKEYLRAIEEIRPMAFVMENVKTLASEKHKFFVENNEEEALKKLDISIVDEFINIGAPSKELIMGLKNFLSDAYNSSEDLSPYLIEKELFSKLNLLLKNFNKSYEKLILFIKKENNHKYFSKVVQSNWESEHNSCIHEYKEKWIKLGNDLNQILENKEINIQSFKTNLEDVIEIQKIVNKISELINYGIKLIDIDVQKDCFEVHLNSYNVFQYIRKRVIDLGYSINDEHYIFNAAQYGVPQERKRLILMGILNDNKNHLREVKVPDPLFYNKDCYYKIYDAIGDLELVRPNTDVAEDWINRGDNGRLIGNPLNEYLNNNFINCIYNHVKTDTREIALKRFKVLGEGQNFHDLDDSLKTTYSDHRRTQNTIYKRLSYNKPSDTVVNVRKSMWVHPVKDRAISIREAARLQSFQDSYKFLGSKDSQYQQIGNAVPPLLARFIAESLLESLDIKVEEKIRTLLDPNNKKFAGANEVASTY